MHQCALCNKEIEEKVYTYSIKKFEKALCRECQTKKVDIPSTKKKDISKTYDFNMIKGRIAESLIEQLFIKLGYKVYRYGMENTVPGIMELLKGVRSDVATIIKRMPDFVIQDKTGEAYFIEVKYRNNEKFSIKEIPKDYPFENAFFIVVSRRHIKCLSFEDLKKGKEISEKSKNYLGNIKAFETDKDIIISFCEYAVKFFKGV